MPESGPLDISELMGIAVLGTMFQFAVPALCAVAWALGWGARRHWAAKMGVAMASAALMFYIAYVRACAALMAG
jgi:hypothetical protein